MPVLLIDACWQQCSGFRPSTLADKRGETGILQVLASLLRHDHLTSSLIEWLRDVMLHAGTRIVCGDRSDGMKRPIFMWTPCLQQAP